MIDRRIGKIRIRRGSDLERQSIIFPQGELIYTTDNKRVYVGDGVTKGGVVISNRNHIVNGIFPLPQKALYGDIIFDLVDRKSYILDYSRSGSLVPIMISDALCCSSLRDQLNLLKNKRNQLLTCLSGIEVVTPTPPVGVLTFVIQPISVNIELGDTATFSASAVGPGDITYQWYKSDTIISGANNNVFEIMKTSLDDVANYKCIATSSIIGSKSSNIANLIIGTAFIISDPSSEFIISDLDDDFISYE